VLVARQLSGGVECILGIHRDPVFGPVAMFGLGGIFVEVMKDVVFHRAPFGEDVAERLIRSIRGAPLLQGARGRPPADIAALARMLSRLSAFAVAAGPRLQGIDLNPVIVLPEGQGAFAVDAVIEIGGAA
jgi:acetate---CoA ligase (ADP-forming)